MAKKSMIAKQKELQSLAQDIIIDVNMWKTTFI